ncbi:hypothetical protein HFO56_24555 [Rhizobium laguerreae]|uniref:hypothetical protein n=1 Tax=Rhizobium laguerreae TaxID=1076926 RepID=UPI001C909B39|nr:hypothetical protein [Rhizobium laguerreae]MBY3155502.1 hypothetical protein [Rhizobium laguerreae]
MNKGYNSNFNNKWSSEMVQVQLNFTNTSTGKKVFEWSFSVPGKRDRIPVEVKAFNNGSDVWFQANGPHLTGEIKSSDINQLKRAVLERLTEQVNLLTNVEWEDWFEVVVKGDNSDFTDSKHSALGADLKIQVNRLKRGVDPATGRVFTVINGSVTDFPAPKRLSDDASMIGGYRSGDVAEISYIPATEENRRAVDNILSRMQELRTSIADLLSQENINESLVTDVLRALPGPKR